MKTFHSLLILASIVLSGCEGLPVYKENKTKTSPAPKIEPKSKSETTKTDREAAPTINYERYMAKLEAERAAKDSLYTQPLSENYTQYLFEVGTLKTEAWLYEDGRYSLKHPGSVRGIWKFRERILTLESFRGEKWVFKPVAGGSFESPHSEGTYLIPRKK